MYTERWMVWLLGEYGDSYASNQYRALQQFFRWWSEEDGLSDPMARLRPPRVAEKLIPVFTSGELSRLELACQGQGRGFGPRWTSPQMLRRYGASARSASARRSDNRIMDATP